MAEQNPPSFMQNVATESAAQGRNMVTGLVPFPGVVNSGDLAVAQNGTPNMTVNVAAGAAFVVGSNAALQGTYHVFNDAVVNKAIAAADPTNPRIDLVTATVTDAFYAGGANSWAITVTTGTPAPSPVAPTAPANSVILAQVAVAALAASIVNANITDKRPRGAALGGAIVCTSATRPSTGIFQGLSIYETDTKREYIYDGTNWRLYGPPGGIYVRNSLTTGNLTVTGANANWADATAALDLILPAVAGDLIELSVDCTWTVAAGSSPLMDAKTQTGAHYVGVGTADVGTGQGVQKWGGQAVAGVSPAGGSYFYVVQSGDLSGGNITFRLRVRQTGATAQTLNATATVPLIFGGRNLGPQV